MVRSNDFALNYRKTVDRLTEQKVDVYIQSTLECSRASAAGYSMTFGLSTSCSAPMPVRARDIQARFSVEVGVAFLQCKPTTILVESATRTELSHPSVHGNQVGEALNERIISTGIVVDEDASIDTYVEQAFKSTCDPHPAVNQDEVRRLVDDSPRSLRKTLPSRDMRRSWAIEDGVSPFSCRAKVRRQDRNIGLGARQGSRDGLGKDSICLDADKFRNMSRGHERGSAATVFEIHATGLNGGLKAGESIRIECGS